MEALNVHKKRATWLRLVPVMRTVSHMLHAHNPRSWDLQTSNKETEIRWNSVITSWKGIFCVVKACIVIIEEYNIMVSSEELIGTAE